MLKTHHSPLTDFGIGTHNDGNIILVGRIGKEQVGMLYLKPPTDEGRSVFQIWVAPEYRRQGIATHLWEIAKSLGLNPVHDSHQTAEGKAWANTVKE